MRISNKYADMCEEGGPLTPNVQVNNNFNNKNNF